MLPLEYCITCVLSALLLTPICDGFDCSGEGGLFADPENCFYFYQCAIGFPNGFHQPCAAGTAWNDAVGQCDFSSEAACARDMEERAMQGQTTEEASTVKLTTVTPSRLSSALTTTTKTTSAEITTTSSEITTTLSEITTNGLVTETTPTPTKESTTTSADDITTESTSLTESSTTIATTTFGQTTNKPISTQSLDSTESTSSSTVSEIMDAREKNTTGFYSPASHAAESDFSSTESTVDPDLDSGESSPGSAPSNGFTALTGDFGSDSSFVLTSYFKGHHRQKMLMLNYSEDVFTMLSRVKCGNRCLNFLSCVGFNFRRKAAEYNCEVLLAGNLDRFEFDSNITYFERIVS